MSLQFDRYSVRRTQRTLPPSCVKGLGVLSRPGKSIAKQREVVEIDVCIAISIKEAAEACVAEGRLQRGEVAHVDIEIAIHVK